MLKTVFQECLQGVSTEACHRVSSVHPGALQRTSSGVSAKASQSDPPGVSPEATGNSGRVSSRIPPCVPNSLKQVKRSSQKFSLEVHSESYHWINKKFPHIVYPRCYYGISSRIPQRVLLEFYQALVKKKSTDIKPAAAVETIWGVLLKNTPGFFFRNGLKISFGNFYKIACKNSFLSDFF